MSTTESILSVDRLTKRFGQLTAVDEISFSISPGEFVGFIGPNGAGKSTTMRSIVGLQHPDSGSVVVAGHQVSDDPTTARGEIGYVPQDLDLYQYLTGEELLRFVAGVRGVDETVVEERIDELLALGELEGAKGRLVRDYSGGMARKIAIASALIARPRLLLLDESFVGLDPESTWRLRKYLERYVAEHEAAVLLSSHILDMLERLCTRIILLHRGKVVADLSGQPLREAVAEHGDLTRLYLARTDQRELLGSDAVDNSSR